MFLGNKKCRIYAACGVSQTPSMIEDVKGRGGSGYVVKKDKLVLEEWFGNN